MARAVRYTRCLAILAVTVWLAGCAGGVDVIPDTVIAEGGDPVDVTADVVGRVVCASDATAVAGTTVTIDSSITATTDSDGVFVIEDVSVGRHWLDVDGAGYLMLGGPMEIEVEAEGTDLGQVVVFPGARRSPPAVPVF
ncbi:MAG: carboxypeptidase-like regulatory domain-containing protein [Armatimonadota bacterium]